MLLTVSEFPLHDPGAVLVLDGSCLRSHLSVMSAMLHLSGVGCTRKELVRGVRCLAEVLLQLVSRLDEVRALA